MRAVCIDATRLSFCMFVYYHTVTHRHPPLPYTTLFRSLHLEAKRGPVCSTRQTGPEYIGPSNRTNAGTRSEEHTSELQSLRHLVCRLLLEKKNSKINDVAICTAPIVTLCVYASESSSSK